MLLNAIQLTTSIKILLSNEHLIKEEPRVYVLHFGNDNFNVKMKKNFVLIWLKQLFN